jgi:uncharacterized membrane protein YfcA
MRMAGPCGRGAVSDDRQLAAFYQRPGFYQKPGLFVSLLWVVAYNGLTYVKENVVDWYSYPLLIAAGFVAGFVNTLAGSGSAVTLPVLIFLGLPAHIANGTNRVAVVLQNVSAVWTFRQRDALDLRGALWLSAPAVLGSVCGAQVSLRLDEATMKQVIGGVMLLMLVIILLRPSRWLQGAVQGMAARPNWKHLLLFFLIGVYGGFIQVGVGIFLLAGLVLGIGYDLVRANAVKVAVVLAFTMVALGVFVWNGRVQWREGLILAAGSMLGGWVGARFAVEKGAIWVRRLLIAIVLFSTAQLLGVIDWLARLW